MRTAAVTRRSTKAWEDMVKERPVFLKFPDNLPLSAGGGGVLARPAD